MNKPTFDAILAHAMTDGRSSSGRGDLNGERQGVYSSTSSHQESYAAAAAAPARLLPVLVFVASRRQTRLTAKELIALQHMHAEGGALFLCLHTEKQQTEFAKATRQVKVSKP